MSQKTLEQKLFELGRKYTEELKSKELAKPTPNHIATQKPIEGQPLIYKKRKREILAQLASIFKPPIVYSNREVDDMILSWCNKSNQNLLSTPGYDVSHLRRGLVDLGYLKRNPEGTLYSTSETYLNESLVRKEQTVTKEQTKPPYQEPPQKPIYQKPKRKVLRLAAIVGGAVVGSALLAYAFFPSISNYIGRKEKHPIQGISSLSKKQEPLRKVSEPGNPLEYDFNANRDGTLDLKVKEGGKYEFSTKGLDAHFYLKHTANGSQILHVWLTDQEAEKLEGKKGAKGFRFELREDGTYSLQATLQEDGLYRFRSFNISPPKKIDKPTEDDNGIGLEGAIKPLENKEALGHFNRGKELYERRSFDGAIENFRKAIALDPNVSKSRIYQRKMH